MSVAPNTRLFMIKPHTGKTHQIRVMLKSLGSPIIGDKAYKGTIEDRTYLHAYALQFKDGASYHKFSCLPQHGRLFNCQQWLQEHPEFFQPWEMSWPVTSSTSN